MILTVGRIAPVKNYEVLIGALKLLADQGLGFSVTIVGEPALAEDCSYAERLKEHVRTLGLADRVVFLGKKQNRELVPIYRSRDIFVHMSKTGSVDKTLLEAMACGMKVISSNDAARAFLKPEAVFLEDDPSSMAKAIRRAADSPLSSDLRRYVVENHNLDTLIQHLADTMASRRNEI